MSYRLNAKTGDRTYQRGEERFKVKRRGEMGFFWDVSRWCECGSVKRPHWHLIETVRTSARAERVIREWRAM